MPTLKLVAKGLFPKELPPSFTGAACESALRTATSPTVKTLKALGEVSPARHSLARAAGTRRQLAIPNPVAEFHLASFIERGWPVISKTIESSPLSRSKPRTRNVQGRAFGPQTGLGDLPILRARNRAVGRHILNADITEFYPSVYSHSIAWAVHGKAYAKQHRFNNALLGNELDIGVRSGQGGQTKGIPVGPDSSLLVGELLLSVIDQELADRVSPRAAFRYYDDFEMSFDQYSEAESALAHLQSILADYELGLNPRKTTISTLPSPSERPWLLRIRDYDFRSQQPDRQRVISFFDDVFRLRQDEREAYVIGYAIARLESTSLDAVTWDLAEQLLAQAVLAEPSAIAQYARLLVKGSIDGRPPNERVTTTLINSIIQHAARLGHDSELAWALWIAIAFELKLSRDSAAAVTQSMDNVVILLALDAQHRGRFARSLDTSRWQSLMTRASLADQNWLVAYEAYVRGWLPSAGGDYIASDLWFSHIRTANVRFYVKFHSIGTRLLQRMAAQRGRSYGDNASKGTMEDEDEDDVDEDDVYA